MPYSFSWKWVIKSNPYLKEGEAGAVIVVVSSQQQQQQQNPDKVATGIYRTVWEVGLGVSENNQMRKQM